ncbi:radical SAM protein, partial [candidate division KSB1 bacterium]
MFLYPSFEWIQIEVTSHCNCACIYCPHTVCADRWISRHIPLSSIKKLIPAFKKTRLVYLQGWGEPFLHPELFTITEMVKEAGSMVGTTTNGTLLHDEMIEKIVES